MGLQAQPELKVSFWSFLLPREALGRAWSCSQHGSPSSLQRAGVGDSASSTLCLREQLVFLWIAHP